MQLGYPLVKLRSQYLKLTNSLYTCHCRFHLILIALIVSFSSSQWESLRHFWSQNLLHYGFKSRDHKLNRRSDRQIHESDYREYGHYGNRHRIHGEYLHLDFR